MAGMNQLSEIIFRDGMCVHILAVLVLPGSALSGAIYYA